MDSLPVSDRSALQVGEAWIQAVTAQDFPRLAGLCRPAVSSRLMTPRHSYTFESAAELSQKVASWFSESTAIHKEQSRVALVGEKLSVFYRLRLVENGQPYTVEQQLYCALLDGQISQVSLLCSGFQPDPAAQASGNPAALEPSAAQPALQSQAVLAFSVEGSSGSTCALLTPSIKRKLGEMRSGQVLEVRVDDPSAQEDIAAWCRLSGNPLLKMEQGPGQDLHFYLMKK